MSVKLIRELLSFNRILTHFGIILQLSITLVFYEFFGNQVNEFNIMVTFAYVDIE